MPDPPEGMSEEELEERLKKLLGATSFGEDSGLTHEPSPPSAKEDEDIEARFKKVSDRLDKARGKSELPEVPEWNYQRPKKAASRIDDKSSDRGIAVGLTLTYALIGPILVGWGIGWLIDRRNGTSNEAQTWGTLLGVVLGFIGFLVILNRTSKTGPKDQ